MSSQLLIEPEAVGIRDYGIEAYLLPPVRYSGTLLARLL